MKRVLTYVINKTLGLLEWQVCVYIPPCVCCVFVWSDTYTGLQSPLLNGPYSTHVRTQCMWELVVCECGWQENQKGRVTRSDRCTCYFVSVTAFRRGALYCWLWSGFVTDQCCEHTVTGDTHLPSNGWSWFALADLQYMSCLVMLCSQLLPSLKYVLQNFLATVYMDSFSASKHLQLEWTACYECIRCNWFQKWKLCVGCWLPKQSCCNQYPPVMHDVCYG